MRALREFDAGDFCIVLGMALLWAGLWQTVGWWALVIMGAIMLLFGVTAALLGRPRAD